MITQTAVSDGHWSVSVDKQIITLAWRSVMITETAVCDGHWSVSVDKQIITLAWRSVTTTETAVCDGHWSVSVDKQIITLAWRSVTTTDSCLWWSLVSACGQADHYSGMKICNDNRDSCLWWSLVSAYEWALSLCVCLEIFNSNTRCVSLVVTCQCMWTSRLWLCV